MSEQPEIRIDLPIPPSIEAVVAQHITDLDQARAVVAALVEREELIADVMRVAGQSFGLLPQIVAEVFAQIRFGAPIPDDQRAMIHEQFHRVIEQIQRGEDPFAPPTINN